MANQSKKSATSTKPSKKLARGINEQSANRVKSWGSAFAVLALTAVVTPFLIGPTCPKKVVIATGSTEGAYFAFANRYRDLLAKDGIELVVKSTAGSIQNLEMLESGEDDVSLAIVQGGTGSEETADPPESLASLYLEPVWVFCRGNEPLERLHELAGKKIAIGAEGSGTRAVALQLLEDNNLISSPTSNAAQTSDTATTVPLGGRGAADALKRGEIDAAFFVISPQSPLVHELLETDGIQLMSFRRAAAYESKYPYLSSVTLSEGMIDLERNIPSREIVLLAPTANLVARSDFHSALVPLFLKAAVTIHEDGGFLEKPNVFPSLRHIDYPANADARRYFKSGPSMLFRHLPFRLAAWLDQMKLILLPLFTLALPFMKVGPPVYRWRIRSKIYRWYRVLREIDQKMKNAGPTEDFSEDIASLKQLEHELAEVSVPLSYMEEFYNLRLHVAYVLHRLAERKPAENLKLHRAA